MSLLQENLKIKDLAISVFKKQAFLLWKHGVLSKRDIKDYKIILGLMYDECFPKTLIVLSDKQKNGTLYYTAYDVVNCFTKRFVTGAF